jgi:hypothetical protein
MFNMIDPEQGRRIIAMVAHSSQDQCREMGEMLIALSKSPRDHHWSANMTKALEGFPAAPTSDLAQRMAAGRARVQARDDELRAAGWHPVQMRAKLEELGYKGTATTTAPKMA